MIGAPTTPDASVNCWHSKADTVAFSPEAYDNL